jgi:hypothetical protein
MRILHPKQQEILNSKAKRKVIRAGRRGGKTTLAGYITVMQFLAGKRVLYAVPTGDQLVKWWYEVLTSLEEPIKEGVFKVNETSKTVIKVGTEQRCRGKTAWNAATLRGDFADTLILDEIQLMSEDTWGEVGAPMLLDNNGDAIFIYTPPSLLSKSASKAKDKRWITKLAKLHEHDPSGRWKMFSFTSYDNPFISREALSEITQDMTNAAYEQEIMAREFDTAAGALWKREDIEKNRIFKHPDLHRVVVAVDPSATVAGAQAGICVVGSYDDHLYILADWTIQGSPQTWAKKAIQAYHRYEADCIVAESNNGGEMVQAVLAQVDPSIRVKLVWASRGKQVRAEPVVAATEQGRVHFVGTFPDLEDELCLFVPGDPSPNRLDAMVWGCTELNTSAVDWTGFSELGHVPGYRNPWV